MSGYEMKISPALAEQVLDKFKLSPHPDITESGLAEIYRACCLNIPFDNIRKRIASTSETLLPLPGFTPTDFFNYWLKFGTGGTCWAGHGALYALLAHLAFPVHYGISTMLSQQPVPGNSSAHGTLIVNLQGEPFIVDATILHGQPLPLKECSSTRSAWGARVHRSGGYWCINWKPLGRPWLDCRLLETNATVDEYLSRHELSRHNSRFDGALLIRMEGQDTITGIVKGEKIVRQADGVEITGGLSDDEQHKLLIEHFSIAEEIVFLIPQNVHR